MGFDLVMSRRLPFISLFFGLYRGLAYQTLSNAFCKKAPQTTNDGLTSNARKVLRLIKISWLTQESLGTKYLRIDQVKFVEDNLWSAMLCLKLFKGCLPQNLLGSFLNTLSHLLESLTEYYLEGCFLS